MTKSGILELIDEILKSTAVGNKIYHTDPLGKKLRAALINTSRYAGPLRNSNHFKITNRMTKGRRYKCVNIVLHNRKLVPITKTAIRQLNKAPKPKRTLILQKLREIIEPQIRKIKTQDLRRIRTFEKTFVESKNYHVDHDEKPFIQLACEWVLEEGYSSFDGLPGNKTYGNNWVFPQEIEESWYQYHEANAVLKTIPAAENLKLSSRDYQAPF